MARTEAEIQAELTKVQAAIDKKLLNTETTLLRVGSGEFARQYQFSTLTLQELYNLRAALYREMEELTGTVSTTQYSSRTNMMTMRK